MRYLLADYDRNRFDKIDDLVRLCYFNPLNTLWGYPWKELNQIGTTFKGLANDDVEYIEANTDPMNTLNGVCFHGTDDFKIWLNPDMRPGGLLFELTLIHELCHGYIGSATMHGESWRRYFGTAVMMYGELLNPQFAETQPEWQVKHTIRRYWGEENPKKPYGELVAKTDEELEAVLDHVDNHVRRISSDFHQLQEMRKACLASGSRTTPTRDYLTSQQAKVGMGYPLR